MHGRWARLAVGGRPDLGRSRHDDDRAPINTRGGPAMAQISSSRQVPRRDAGDEETSGDVIAGIISQSLAHTREGRTAEAIACLTARDEIALSTDVACNILGLLHASLNDDR